MPPQNPGVYKVASDGRLTIARGFVPSWLKSDDSQSYCVPLHWKREISIPQGHDLEAWVVWNPAIQSSDWITDPKILLPGVQDDPQNYSRRSLMFQVRFDDKDRLCCAGLFSNLSNIAGRIVWVAQENDSLSIWTNFAFQATHGQTRD